MDLDTLSIVKKYVKNTLQGTGALAGKNVIISNISPIKNGNKITFSYTLDNGTTKTSSIDVRNGLNGNDGQDGTGITGVKKISVNGQIDTYRINFSNGDFFDFEITNGEKGEKGEKGDPGEQGIQGKKGIDGKDGISPLINVYSETDSEYILEIKDKNGTIITPNLMGTKKAGDNSEPPPSYGNSCINQSTFLNISNGGTKEILINSQQGKILLQAYKFIEGEQDIVKILKTFNNMESGNFNYNPENVLFNNPGMQIRDSYTLELCEYLDGLYISQQFNLNDYVSFYTPKENEAQTLRPNNDILIGSRIPMTEYEIGEYVLRVNTTPHGLFNGVSAEEWSSENVCYMNSFDYFIITFHQPVNIYRSGTYGWSSYTTQFEIYKLDEETKEFIDITSNIKQTTSPIGSMQWELTIEELPAGTYKFCTPAGGYRLDSEWFLEIPVFSYLLKNNEELYCINEKYYNAETGLYEAVGNIDFSGIECDYLFSTPKYLNGLRPVDKFTGNMQLIQNKFIPTVIHGIKSNSELVVANGDINNGIADTINNIILTYKKTENADIKIAFSLDKGETWNTFNGEDFKKLDITIPAGNYKQLSEGQKEQWENAKEIIALHGIGCVDFNDTEFNSKLMQAFNNHGTVYDTIRFAYVLIRPAYDDNCLTTELKWNFNAKGHMDLMIPGTEYTFSIYQYKIEFKSLIESSLVTVNIFS